MWPDLSRSAPSARYVAASLAIGFVAVGFAYVFVTDLLLYSFTRDSLLIGRLETAKGFVFIAGTAVALYSVSIRAVAKIAKAHATTAAVVESIGDGVLLLGRDRTIMYANPAACRMLRLEPIQLVGMGADEFSRRFRVSYQDGSLVRPDEFVSQRVFDERGPLNYTAVLHPPGCADLVISSTAAAVRSELERGPDLVVSVMHDITATEESERIRDEFFAAAAHGLKTPVAVIKTNAQLLSSGGTIAARSRDAIVRQCGRIDRLVQNLLVLSRVRSKTLRLHPMDLELRRVVEDVARDMARASVAHEVRATVEGDALVHADRERIMIVVRNMIEDALRDAAIGAPVTVLLERHGADAEIGVRYDRSAAGDGDGEADDGDGEGRADIDDLGVGRFVTATIVGAHGGALRGERRGRETTSWLRLPAMEAPDGHG